MNATPPSLLISMLSLGVAIASLFVSVSVAALQWHQWRAVGRDFYVRVRFVGMLGDPLPGQSVWRHWAIGGQRRAVVGPRHLEVMVRNRTAQNLTIDAIDILRFHATEPRPSMPTSWAEFLGTLKKELRELPAGLKQGLMQAPMGSRYRTPDRALPPGTKGPRLPHIIPAHSFQTWDVQFPDTTESYVSAVVEGGADCLRWSGWLLAPPRDRGADYVRSDQRLVQRGLAAIFGGKPSVRERGKII